MSLDGNMLAIKFGNRCNLSCEYCIQNHMLKSLDYKYNPSLLIPRMKDIMFNNFNKKCDVFFVGGEPLLYKDVIYDIVDKLKPLESNHRYLIYTNGYYLNDEIVSFLNEHNFKVVVSWDGTASRHTRGYNFFDDIEKLNNAKKIKNLYFSMLLTNESLLLDKFDVLFKFNKQYLRIHEYNINLVFRIAHSYYYTKDTIKQLKEELEFIRTTRYNNILESLFLNGECRPLYKNLISFSSDGKRIVNPSENINNIRYDSYSFCKSCEVSKYCMHHFYTPYKTMYCYLCKMLYTK